MRIKFETPRQPIVGYFDADEISVVKVNGKFVVRAFEYYNQMNGSQHNQYRYRDLGTFATETDAKDFADRVRSEAN